MRTSSLLILALTLPVACAGDDATSGGVSGSASGTATTVGSASATSTSGGTSTSGTSGTASGSGGSSGSGGTSGGTSSGTGGVCDGFADALGPSVPVQVTNTSDAPVYVGADPCESKLAWSFVDAANDEVIPGLTECVTCESAVQGLCGCPPPNCSPTAALRLDPGASVEFDVRVVRYVTRDIPEQCPGNMPGGPTCEQAELFSEGTYSVRVRAATAVECGGQPCDCSPDQTGTCWVEMEGNLVDPAAYDGMFDVPDPGIVDVLIP